MRKHYIIGHIIKTIFIGGNKLIFVTLGTQDKHFPRLLEAVEKLN